MDAGRRRGNPIALRAEEGRRGGGGGGGEEETDSCSWPWGRAVAAEWQFGLQVPREEKIKSKKKKKERNIHLCSRSAPKPRGFVLRRAGLAGHLEPAQGNSPT
ncbi:hypothetical protein EYF80_041988 [Liparis tanakae]|uniref:Uncharacterized protein n=1 Tax=Liparis tanakae TaxID=230148 RepID=A0A4Z2G3A9_9TELE|nr:hypothetical protein EYF80_041988 [Liparis tanakae]